MTTLFADIKVTFSHLSYWSYLDVKPLFEMIIDENQVGKENSVFKVNCYISYAVCFRERFDVLINKSPHLLVLSHMYLN